VTSSRLEYAIAFDLAASWLGGFRGACLGLVSNDQFGDELRTRGGSRLRIVRSAADLVASERVYDAVVWAAPQADTWRRLVPRVATALRPGGALCILTATRVGGLVSPLRRARLAGEPSALVGPIAGALPRHGLQIRRVYPLGGLSSLAWALAGRAALLVSRPDLADRAERAHHSALESRSAASFQLLLAERASDG